MCGFGLDIDQLIHHQIPELFDVSGSAVERIMNIRNITKYTHLQRNRNPTLSEDCTIFVFNKQ